MSFQEAIGTERIAARGRLLARYVRERMAQSGWAELVRPSVPSMSGLISTFRLSGFGELSPGESLYGKYRISTPVHNGGDSYLQRVSTHVYNGFDEIDALIGALEELRGEPPS